MEEYWTAMDALQEGEIGVVRRIGLEGTCLLYTSRCV